MSMSDVDQVAFEDCMKEIRNLAERSRSLARDVHSFTKEADRVLIRTRMAEHFDRIADAEEAAR